MVTYPGRRLFLDHCHMTAEGIQVAMAAAASCVLRSVKGVAKPGPGEGKITIVVNGEPQAEMIISTEWSTWDITLPGEAVLDDLNEIVVRWPMPEFHSAEALSTVAERLCELKLPNFFPVFGEIHSFTAANGQEVAANIPVVQEAVAASGIS